MTENALKRDESGRFLPGGKSPNPLGRRLQRDPEAVKLAKDHCVEAIRRAVNIMIAEKTNTKNRLNAIKLILSYGIGMPKQRIDVSDTIGFLDVLRELNPDRPVIEGETDNPALEGESGEVCD